MTSMMSAIRPPVSLLLFVTLAEATWAAKLPTFAGPAMGTTYRVTLAGPVPGHSVGELHRATDRLLARLDEQLSTWRADSDAARFNRAEAGVWVEVGSDLLRLIAISKDLQRRTDGRFDITVGPLVRWWRDQQTAERPNQPQVPPATLMNRIGLELIEIRPASTTRPAALRKRRAGVEMTLGAIGPGYAVDRIGECLLDLGSSGHLVELGGEVRGWGHPREGNAWTVAVRGGPSETPPPRMVQLADGEAVAVAQPVATRPVIDPRTGSLASPAFDGAIIIRASSCAEADALATAAVIPD